MPRTYATTARVGGFAQGARIAGSNRADVLLRDRPRGLDGVQVGGVGRQVFDATATCLDERNDAGIVVRGGIVEDDDVAGAQLRSEPASNPVSEAIAIGCADHRAHRDPSVPTNRTDHREAVLPPVHWAAIDADFAPADPRMRTAHREVRCGFIEENEPIWIDAF